MMTAKELRARNAAIAARKALEAEEKRKAIEEAEKLKKQEEEVVEEPSEEPVKCATDDEDCGEGEKEDNSLSFKFRRGKKPAHREFMVVENVAEDIDEQP